MQYFAAMRIGFDAKRAFHNFTGLGNYSRTLIHSLASLHRDHQYILFNPMKSERVTFPEPNIRVVHPGTLWGKAFPSIWRSRWMTQDIRKQNLQLYHGLSHELPFGVHQLPIPKVVTIHDLIFEHYPKQYRKNDVAIYRKKFQFACQHADRIIAISKTTAADLMSLYQVPESKISVCYQACDPRFYSRTPEHWSEAVRHKYGLPELFWLSVGSIIERKNLLQVVEAFAQMPSDSPALVVIGKGSQYKQQVQARVQELRLVHRVFFLEDRYSSRELYTDLPSLYQMAQGLLYPSRMEGFGLPVVEAMASGTPVITSQHTSMSEIGENSSVLIDPNSTEEIRSSMMKLWLDDSFRRARLETGLAAAAQFTTERTSAEIMNLYKQLW